ncbi:MAG: 4Fe-4S binding protein [Anaerolineae bacterium]|nr:4Fe-4S binding protein [Anaerolineae bacterium]
MVEIEREDRIYKDLAQHLDKLPGGFGSQDSTVERRLLKRLFTLEEAELAIHLNIEREDAAAIAARAGLRAEVAERRLTEMAQKGLILSVTAEDGTLRYEAVPWVVGIYEFQIGRLDDELLKDIDDYWRTRKPSDRPSGPQMRTIPIGESIDIRLEVLPYENVDALIAAEDRFAVAPCICRHTAKMHGGGCDAPEETCLSFGDFADYYVRTGRGRAIDRDEVAEILARADAANLVLQPSNSKEAAFICCCCGCCCGILQGIKRHPKPSDVVVNAFIAQLDPELCQNCKTCLERCQMEALTAGEDHVFLNTDRCIGCGLCVSTCPTEALTLVRKPDRPGLEPPRTFEDAWRTAMEAQDTR